MTRVDEGFEVWEIGANVGEEEVLTEEIMISHQNARKWVHDSTLVQKRQGREDPVDLPDKPKGGGKLGKKGERRFAPRRTGGAEDGRSSRRSNPLSMGMFGSEFMSRT